LLGRHVALLVKSQSFPHDHIGLLNYMFRHKSSNR
jgi:hypothetical protein